MMQYAAAGFAFALVCASCPVPARSGEHEVTIASADRLFEAGEFVQARKQFAQTAADQPNSYPAILHLGRIALLSKSA